MKWCDKWDVRMLSTLHSDETVNNAQCEWKKKQSVMKSKCIVDYSCKMGAVDGTDMLLSYVQCISKSVKWYKILALAITWAVNVTLGCVWFPASNNTTQEQF
jgi:hypothetical protein